MYILPNRFWLLVGLAVMLAACSYFLVVAQNKSPEIAWQYSVSGSVQIGVREKEGRIGSFTAQFIVTNPAGEQYSAQRFIGASQFGYVYFPQDFGVTVAKPGGHTWMCVVDKKIVANGQFDYVVLSDYAGQGVPLAELEREKERFEREREAEYESGKLDEYLWVKVRAALVAEGELRDKEIKVEVEKGVVTLSGIVRSMAQKSEAERRARNVNGVRGIKNQITISPKK